MPKNLKARETVDKEKLTPGAIAQITGEIQDGNADPEQAIRLLRHFLDCTERGRPDQKILPAHLLEHFRWAFTKYLRNPEHGYLERLLGLVRPKKRPRIREARHKEIALEVLRRRLRGDSLAKAAAHVGKTFSIHESKVQDIWAGHKEDALNLERISRVLDDPEQRACWTREETERLRKIYRRLTE